MTGDARRRTPSLFSAQHRGEGRQSRNACTQRSPETITTAFGGEGMDASRDSKLGRGNVLKKGAPPQHSARLQLPGLQQGFAGVRQTALHFEGAGKHKPAIPIFGTQSHALAGQRFRKLRIFPAVKVEVGHEAEGGHIAGIAEQRLMQMLAGLIRFAEPQGETGKVPLRWMPEYTAFGTLESRYDEDE